MSSQTLFLSWYPCAQIQVVLQLVVERRVAACADYVVADVFGVGAAKDSGAVVSHQPSHFAVTLLLLRVVSEVSTVAVHADSLSHGIVQLNHWDAARHRGTASSNQSSEVAFGALDWADTKLAGKDVVMTEVAGTKKECSVGYTNNAVCGGSAFEAVVDVIYAIKTARRVFCIVYTCMGWTSNKTLYWKICSIDCIRCKSNVSQISVIVSKVEVASKVFVFLDMI